jgi:hypothetical protein
MGHFVPNIFFLLSIFGIQYCCASSYVQQCFMSLRFLLLLKLFFFFFFWVSLLSIHYIPRCFVVPYTWSMDGMPSTNVASFAFL